MQAKKLETQQSITLADVYFIVFRHKWKIIVCLLLGLMVGAGIFLFTEKVYVSEAKILIKYVAEPASGNPTTPGNERSPDPGGQGIINSEIQILTSRDLAEEVVDLVGPDKILRTKGAGGSNRIAAVDNVAKNLKHDVPGSGSVIALYFEHADPAVAQLVLKVLVDKYHEKHIAAHKAEGAYEFLVTQTDQLHQRLLDTDNKLRQIRTNAGIFSFESSRAGLGAQLAQLRSDITRSESKLASLRALPDSTPTNGLPRVTPLPARDNRYYKTICETLDGLRGKELEMLGRLTESNPAVVAVHSQIQDLEKKKHDMELADPQLGLMSVGPTGVETRTFNDASQIPILEAELKILQAQLQRVRSEAASLDAVEQSIQDLERRKAIEEENYKFFSTSLERAKIDQALETSKISNISVVQAATTAALLSQHRGKSAGIATAAGLAFGVLLALLFEFVLDPTVKRPVEFTRQSLMPVMLTIPTLGVKNSRRKRLPFGRRHLALTSDLNSLPDVADHGHPMRPYFDAVRDRLLVQFEGIARKPKLVGVTSCANGAGSSLLAAGLAASLSETGDGNVLLVDLNVERGAAHQFFNGKPVCALHDAVEEDKRDHGLAQEKLYLASVNQPNGSPTMPPARKIAELMPRLRASDYDYIIFDMPPVSPTSVTFRIAGLMDDVLMVVESERTSREALKQAHTLLTQSKAKVEAVLNMYNSPVPKALCHELNGPEDR